MSIAIISTSTRPGRTSHRVALALKRTVETAGQSVSLIDLKELTLPLFSERFAFLTESERSENMIKIAEILQQSKAIIFVTPEYNGSISTGLKNLLDTFGKAEFAGKPIGVATASTGIMGGIRAAQQLQINILGVQAYPQPQMLTVGEVDKQMDTEGEVLNTAFGPKLNGFVTAFLGFVARF
jgi:NAD(P)H-dependent FMN reductase